MAVDGIDILEKTAMYMLLRALEHHTDAKWSVVSVDESMSELDVGGSPQANGISSPGLAHFVLTVEVRDFDIVRPCYLEALPTWVWPAYILGNYVCEGCSGRLLDRNTL